MNDKHLERFIEEIKRDEGYSDKVYPDSEDNPTGGWGHHFAIGSPVPKDVAELLLEHDIANAINDFYRISKKTTDLLNPVRKRVICNMIFNMGLPKVMNFKKMWKAIKKQDFATARAEMLDSHWSQQVGRRAFRLADMMESGEEIRT